MIARPLSMHRQKKKRSATTLTSDSSVITSKCCEYSLPSNLKEQNAKRENRKKKNLNDCVWVLHIFRFRDETKHSTDFIAWVLAYVKKKLEMKCGIFSKLD